MKLLRFNEKYRLDPTDKIIKGTITMEYAVVNFEIPKDDLMSEKDKLNQDSYSQNIDIESAIFNYIHDRMDTNNVESELVDYKGNVIEDEDAFDNAVKYNML